MAAPMGVGSSRAYSRPSRPKLMRCYVIATGIVFALMFVAHVARVFAEGSGILREPLIIVTSVIALGFTVWAVVLLTRRPR